MADARLPAAKQTEIVKACKHLLELARAGRLVAIGYAELHVDDDGDITAGSNAAWTDNVQIREALKTTVVALAERIKATSGIIIN